jgi:hypothetical protein
MEICGEYFKLPTDKDLFAYFRTHYPPLLSPPDGSYLVCPTSR